MSWILSGLWGSCHGDLTQLVNSRFCVVILFLLAATHVLLVSVYFPAAISCFGPSHMTAPQVMSINAMCLSSTATTYELLSDIPYPDEEEVPLTLSYYQYVSLVLVIQAILFYTPSIIWKESARKVGILPDELSVSAVEARHTKNASDRESSVRLLAKHVQSFCTRQLHRRHVSYAFWWIHGNKLVIVQIVCKLVFAANVIGQFFLLDAFLGMPFHNYGWHLLGRIPSYFNLESFLKTILQLDVDDLTILGQNTTILLNNRTRAVLDAYIGLIYQENRLEFPQQLICDAEIRRLGNIQRYSVQCVLPINSLNELIFQFVWFLFFATSVVTIASLIHAVFTFVFFVCRRMSIRERLQDQGVIKRHDPRDGDTVREITTFERDFLQRDGLLLIGCIESAAGDVIADDVIKYLWEFYKENCLDLLAIAQRVRWMEEVEGGVDVRQEGPLVRVDPYTAVAMETRGAYGEQPPAYEGLPASAEK